MTYAEQLALSALFVTAFVMASGLALVAWGM